MKQYNVLIVDDSKNVQCIEKCLRNQFCKIVSACSGKVALNIFREMDIDILISKMELMDINGRALFLSMKKRRPDMQCILISDHNCNSNVQECDQLQVFKRSVDMKSLSELVNQMVSKMEKNQLLHKNILVVEDTRVLLLTQVKMLKKLGFTNIDIAHNGKQAIELLNEKDDYPGLIISDWYMPEKNGLELLQWVRTNERFKHTPFIMATSKKEAMMAIEAGANHFLIKPFDMETIQTAIEKVLGASN